VPSDAAVSFVHVLSLSEGWAHCVGLPREMWDQPASTQALATSADGRSLYIVDSARGLVTVMDTKSLEISGTHQIDLHRTGTPHTSAVLSSDGRTLFIGAGGTISTLVAIDTTTFEVTDRWTAAGDASGIGLSDDGLRLYVALEDRVEVFDPTTGGELGAVPLVSPGPVLEVSALAG
jgi:DNA-binding beta-propeller fold protein YncE